MEYNEFSRTLTKSKQIVSKQKRKPFGDKTNNSSTFEKVPVLKIHPCDNYVKKINNSILTSILEISRMNDKAIIENKNSNEIHKKNTMRRKDSLANCDENINKSNLKFSSSLRKTGKENIPITDSKDVKERKNPMIKTPVKKLTDDDILELLQCDIVQPTPPQILSKKILQNKSLHKCLLHRSAKNLKDINSDNKSNHTGEIINEEKVSPVKKINCTKEVNLTHVLNKSLISMHDNFEDTVKNKTFETSKINLRQKKRIDYAAMLRNSSFSKSAKKVNVGTNLKVLIPNLNESYLQNLNISNKSEILDNLNKKIPIYKSLHENALSSGNKENCSAIYEFQYDLNEDCKVKRKKRVLHKFKNKKTKMVNNFFNNKSKKNKIPLISNKKKTGASALSMHNNISVPTSAPCVTTENVQAVQTAENSINNDFQNQIEDENDVIESSEILDSEFNNIEQSIDQTILEDFSNIEVENLLSTVSNSTVTSNVANSPWRLNGPVIKSSLLFETNKSMLPRFNQDLLITEIKNKFYLSPSKTTIRKHQNNSLLNDESSKIIEKNQTKNVETELVQSSETSSKEVDQENISNNVLFTQPKKKKSIQTTILSFMNSTKSKSLSKNNVETIINTPANLSQFSLINSENESTPSENRAPVAKDFPFTPIRRSERHIRKPLQLLTGNISKNDNSIVEDVTDKNSSEDSLFGFKSLVNESLKKTRHNKNKNITGPARVSTGAIREILNKNQKAEEKNNKVKTISPAIEFAETTENVEDESIQNTNLIQSTELIENSVGKNKENDWINSSSDDDENSNKDCTKDNTGIQGIGLFEENDVPIFRHEGPRHSYTGKKKRKRRVYYESGSENDKDDETSPYSPKKKKKKNLRSKKEEEEAERWAQQFNSMCEEVEQFELLVE